MNHRAPSRTKRTCKRAFFVWQGRPRQPAKDRRARPNSQPPLVVGSLADRAGCPGPDEPDISQPTLVGLVTSNL